MEITQINIPHMPDLQALFADAVQVPNVEMSGVIEFIKENWFGILVVAALICGLLYWLYTPKKTENDKPKEEPPITLFNQPITYIQRPNGNVGQ